MFLRMNCYYTKQLIPVNEVQQLVLFSETVNRMGFYIGIIIMKHIIK